MGSLIDLLINDPKRFDFLQAEKDEESFRWISAEKLDERDFAFPADRKVVQLLQL